MQKSSKHYWVVLILIFTLSAPAKAQSGLEGPSITEKRAKEEMEAGRKKEKGKRKEDKAVKKYNTKKAKKENIEPKYKGIFRKRKREAKKSRSQPQASQ